MALTVLRLAAVWLATWPQFALAEDRVLNGGWTEFPPYSYQTTSHGIARWEGFDVELLEVISKRAGVLVVGDETPWDEHVAGIRDGTLDIAPHAVLTAERQAFATFSIPYRTETMVLVLRKDDTRYDSATTTEELVDLFENRRARIGFEPGVEVPDFHVRRYAAAQRNAPFIESMRGFDLTRALIGGEIDAFWADRVEIAYLADALEVTGQIKEHQVKVTGSLHLMFNSKNVHPQTIIRFNRAIESVLNDGTFHDINVRYSFPILVSLSLDQLWFRMVDLLGTVAFAISGLLLAYRYHYDIFGAMVLAALPAIGGGIVRDLISGRGEVAALQDPIYISIVVGLVVGGFALIRIAELLGGLPLASDNTANSISQRLFFSSVQLFDAIGLAAFTVTGVVVALLTFSQPLWIWGPILAALTAAGGGILRDITRSDPEIPALKGELYPEVALLWGFILSLFLSWEARLLEPNHIGIGILVTFFGALVTRLLVIYFKIKSPRFA
ncbi:MAG: TRIC cation channel family protein [Pseudomonadota bacterium]